MFHRLPKAPGCLSQLGLLNERHVQRYVDESGLESMRLDGLLDHVSVFVGEKYGWYVGSAVRVVVYHFNE